MCVYVFVNLWNGGVGPIGIQDLISLFSGFISGKSGQKW